MMLAAIAIGFGFFASGFAAMAAIINIVEGKAGWATVCSILSIANMIGGIVNLQNVLEGL